MWVVVGRHTIPPPKVVLIDRLGIVVERAVVATHRKILLDKRRLTQHFSNLMERESVVGQAQGLIMHVAIAVALISQHVSDRLLAPSGPVM